MKTSSIFVFFCLFFQMTVSAQKITHITPVIEGTDKEPILIYVKDLGKNYYLEVAEKEVVGRYYEKNSFKKINEPKLANKEPKSGKTLFYNKSQDKIYEYFREIDEKANETTSFLQSYDMDFNPVGAKQQIAKFAGTGKRGTTILWADNYEKLVIFNVREWALNKKDKSKNSIVNIFWHNQNFEQTASIVANELPYEYTDADYFLSDFNQENNEVSLWFKLRDSKGYCKKCERDTYERVLYKPDGSRSIKRLVLSDLIQYIQTANIKTNDQGITHIYGFYNEEKYTKSNISHGVFFLVLDKDLNVIKKVQQPFSLDFIKSFNYENLLVKDKNLMIDFEPLYLLFNQDESIIMLAQRKSERFSSDRLGSRIITRTSDFLWIKFGKDGTMDIKQMMSNAVSENVFDGALSFLPHHDKQTGEVFLLFNGYEEEKDKISGIFEASRMFINRKEKVVLSVKITANGELSKTIIYDTDNKDKCIFRPQASLKVNDKEYILFFRQNKKYRLGLLKFD